MTASEKPEHINIGRPNLATGHPLHGQCYLCGAKEGLTIEHVVPKAVQVFEEPVTLKSCQACNTAKARDEEYIIHFLAAGSFNSVGRARWQKSLARFAQGKTEGIRHDMIKRLSKRDVKSHTGETLKNVDTIAIDAKRMDSFFLKIAKGLLVRSLAAPLEWDDFEISHKIDQGIQSMEMLEGSDLGYFWKKPGLGEYWGKTFSYKVVMDTGKEAYFVGTVLYDSFISCHIFVRKDSAFARLV